MHDSAWSTKAWQRGWNLVKILESGVSFLNIPQLCAWMPHCQVKQIEPKLSGSPSLTWWNNTYPMGCSGSHSELSAWVCLWVEDDAVSGKWDCGAKPFLTHPRNFVLILLPHHVQSLPEFLVLLIFDQELLPSCYDKIHHSLDKLSYGLMIKWSIINDQQSMIMRDACQDWSLKSSGSSLKCLLCLYLDLGAHNVVSQFSFGLLG